MSEAPPASVPPTRVPRTVPAAHALEWFSVAMRLWRRGPLTFCAFALAVVVASVVLEQVPVAGAVAAHVLAPLLACGLLYASLAADRGDRPRWRHLVAAFAAPLRAQAAVVAGGLVPLAVEAIVAWSVAGVNVLLPLPDAAQLSAGAIAVIYAAGVAASLPVTFVPMAALFDGEPFARAFATSLAAFARNVPALAAYAAFSFVLLAIGIATSGLGLLLALPWIAAASYAAWKDVFAVGAWKLGSEL